MKPSNILLSEDGVPKLSDFGVAKILNLEETLELTTTGFGVGTPEYMAPEQAGRNFDERVDIYSLAIVFYELLTGIKPFTGETPFAVILAHNTQPVPDPKKYNSYLSEKAIAVIKKGFTKKAF